MKYIDLINYGNEKLTKKKLEKNVAFKILFFVDKEINNILEFTQKRNEKISLSKAYLYKYYLFQYVYLNKPLQYITKESFFYGNNFIIYKNVHSPKIESEVLVEKAVNLINTLKYKNVLDLCCGTGVLGISVLLKTKVNLTLSDINKKAIKNTFLNLKKYNLEANVIKSNLFNKIDKKFDLIICNPPYIAFGDKFIDKSVKKYENNKSLFAKNNGLYFYQKIMTVAHEKLNKDGIIIFEIGFNQINEVIKIISSNKNVTKIEKIKDALGYYRMVVVYF